MITFDTAPEKHSFWCYGPIAHASHKRKHRDDDDDSDSEQQSRMLKSKN